MTQFKLPSLNVGITPTEHNPLPSVTPSVPPPEKDLLEEKPVQPNPPKRPSDDDDSDDKIDDDDDSIDSIKTEEDVEEIEIEGLEDILFGGIPKSTNDAMKKNKTENRSLRIIKQIIEPFEDIDGNDIFDKEMKSVEDKRRERVRNNPELDKVFGDNREIIIDDKMIANVMTSTDERLEISKQTGIIMKTICKVFLAELVSEAQKVRAMDQNGSGPLLPQEVLIAYRRLTERGSIPNVHRPAFFADN